MESKWSANVTDKGIANWGAIAGIQPAANPTLASRILTGPYAGAWLLNVVVSNASLAVYYLPDMERWDTLGGIIRLPGHPNFPYGMEVEPNGPV